MDKKCRVLVIDDASFMTKAISEILESDPGIEVIGTAKNGLEGLEKVKELHPDVITLDMDMPVMNGIQAIRHIMIEAPVPIVVLSSLFSDGAVTFDALRLGVVDFVAKPSGAISTDIHTSKQKIIDRVKLAESVQIDKISRVQVSGEDSWANLSKENGSQSLDYIVAIGTSLTGPNTFIKLLTTIPVGLPAAIVVILEISSKILPSFVEKFNEFTPWKIDTIENGAVLESGSCYLHPNSSSLVLSTNKDGNAFFELGEPVENPLDVFFSSAAAVFKEQTVGVLLTGYGCDGVNGFTTIKEKSGTTVAQSVETCVYPNLTDYAIKHTTVDWIVAENKLAETIESIIQ